MFGKLPSDELPIPIPVCIGTLLIKLGTLNVGLTSAGIYDIIRVYLKEIL